MRTCSEAAAARQLGFPYHGRRLPAARRVLAPRPGAARLCSVCGRLPARLTLDAPPGGRPARVCLRCHQAALRQRRAAVSTPAPCAVRRAAPGGRSDLSVSRATDVVVPRGADVVAPRGTDLIVPRGTDLAGEAKYRLLSRSRRQAQEVARRALGCD